jgi:hypothetical protein
MLEIWQRRQLFPGHYDDHAARRVHDAAEHVWRFGGRLPNKLSHSDTVSVVENMRTLS